MIKGLRFFTKTNIKRTCLLASLHHPWSLTWRWSIWWAPLKVRIIPKFYNWRGGGHREITFTWLFGCISFNSQPNMRRT